MPISSPQFLRRLAESAVTQALEDFVGMAVGILDLIPNLRHGRSAAGSVCHFETMGNYCLLVCSGNHHSRAS